MAHPTFNWRGKPSLADQIKPKKGNKNPGQPITLRGSNPHGGAYSRAVAAAPDLTEEQIKGADSMFGVLP